MPSFSLAVPESWWEFDVRPEGREATTMLRKMAKDAHDSSALHMGCMAENFDGIPSPRP